MLEEFNNLQTSPYSVMAAGEILQTTTTDTSNRIQGRRRYAVMQTKHIQRSAQTVKP